MSRRPDHLLVAFAYDGARFRGVWPQPDVPTASAALLDRLHEALGQRPRAFAVCARTDAGVHAAINLATVRLWPDATTEDLGAIEQPRDDGLGAVRAVRVPNTVHARGFALAKRYRYRFNDPHLDVQAMSEAARSLVGTYNVSALRGRGVRPEACANRTVDRVDIDSQHGVVLTVEGPHFVRYQVRNMAALLARYGRGEAPPSQLEWVLREGDPRNAEWPAPADGLSLCALRIRRGPQDDRQVWVDNPDHADLHPWAIS